MPYDRATSRGGKCCVCGADANLLSDRMKGASVGKVINCSVCGDIEVTREAIDDFRLPFSDPPRCGCEMPSRQLLALSGQRRPPRCRGASG